MKIGILGSGDVAQALARGFLGIGDEVKLGAREATNEKLAAFVAKEGDRASHGTFADAAAFGELIILATLGVATEAAIAAAGKGNFDGKLVVDTTNPIDFSTGKPALAFGHTDSLGERIQRQLPGAKVVKCWNSVGNAHMIHPSFEGGPPDMFICGDDAGAKARLGELLRGFGWGVADLGGISASRYLEPMCMVWVHYALTNGGWNHAFKLLRK